MEKKKLQHNLIYTEVGAKIQVRRKKLKYNQDQLSSAIGLTRTSVVNIEKGRQGFPIDTLLKICAVLKCTPMDLLPKVPSAIIKETVTKKKVIEYKAMSADFKW